jgi:hypothetical protein
VLPAAGNVAEELLQTNVSYEGARAWLRQCGSPADLPPESVWRQVVTQASRIAFSPVLRSRLQQCELSVEAASLLDRLLPEGDGSTLADAMLMRHGILEWVLPDQECLRYRIMGYPGKSRFAMTGAVSDEALEMISGAGHHLIGFRVQLSDFKRPCEYQI